MTHLVYHGLSSSTGQLSPFDEAILKVAQSARVGIVSPYIGVDYLLRITEVSETWRLISDIEAWLSSLSMRARPKAWQFIRENLDRIHHCTAVHAKVVVSPQLGFLGSSNLTSMGILGRTEMGILIDEPKMVSELREWFDMLWKKTHSPIVDEANAFIQWLDDEARRAPDKREKFSISSSGLKIRAQLVKIALPKHRHIEPASIHLEKIAKDLIIKDQHHFETLAQMVESSVDALADTGFSFEQFIKRMRQTSSTSTIREIYFSLLQHCANHVRSVFSESTRNRLILTDGRFVQSSKDMLHEALKPFDLYLVKMVANFDFAQARHMPAEDVIEATTEIQGDKQTILTSSLLEIGFLEIHDLPGQLPKYTLSDSFEWKGRHSLFVASMRDWNAKNNRLKTRPAESKIRQSTGKAYSHSSDEISLESRIDKMSLADYLRSNETDEQKTEKIRSNIALVNTKEKYAAIDKILAHLLPTLLSGEKLKPIDTLLQELPLLLDVKSTLVKRVLRGKDEKIPKIIIMQKGNVKINQNLDWKDISEPPLTQKLFAEFIKL